ncbi:uncharacterized protein N7498_007855 [Penicillium cinerascens]|uniref:Uncharacterized protein n=1 Tax=Penicillium cinerascens TaxID=70096 RepID=A0A9W9JKU1_9EURO|nr:uncharacterized protein N7498_007855 [Penicillium cinerascens]KAJ5198738.1 hypothetical protein N7498_007855 [Penicillium cinerascens]
MIRHKSSEQTGGSLADEAQEDLQNNTISNGLDFDNPGQLTCETSSASSTSSTVIMSDNEFSRALNPATKNDYTITRADDDVKRQNFEGKYQY